MILTDEIWLTAFFTRTIARVIFKRIMKFYMPLSPGKTHQ